MSHSENKWMAVLPILSGFFVMGFCDIVGIASDYVQRSFGWSSTMAGIVPSLVFLWFLVLAIPTANLMGRIGCRRTVMVSLVITIVGTFLPLLAYDSVACLITFALIGIGNTMLQVSLNPLICHVVPQGSLRASSLTAGQVVKALSSLAGPEIVMIAVTIWDMEHWFYCFPIMGVITLLSALWMMTVPEVQADEQSGDKLSMGKTFALLANSRMLVLFIGILAIVGLDVSTNFLSSKLMASRFDWQPEMAKFAPQVYFLCRTVGAFIGVALLARISEVLYFRVNGVLCVLSLVVMAFAGSATLTMVCIGAVGFFASTVFSIIYSVAFSYYPKDTGSVSGLLITAVAGGGIVTPLLGWTIDHAGMVGGICVILACALYLLGCACWIKKDSHSLS